MSLFVYENGYNYLHYDNWLKHRYELCQYYPRQKGKFRIDIELSHPTLFLSDVPVKRNPHGSYDLINGLGERCIKTGTSDIPQRCYYLCDDWTTIFDVHEFTHPENTIGIRTLVESGNKEPISGERMILYSTSSNIWDEPWGANKANRFAYFRGKYWFVSFIEFLHGRWKFYSNYPLSSVFYRYTNYYVPVGKEHECYTAEDFLPPTYLSEKANPVIGAFLTSIRRNPTDYGEWLIFADCLADNKEDYLADYIRLAIKIFMEKDISPKLLVSEVRDKDFLHFYDDRPRNIRTAIFLLTLILQNAYSQVFSLYKNRTIALPDYVVEYSLCKTQEERNALSEQKHRERLAEISRHNINWRTIDRNR